MAPSIRSDGSRRVDVDGVEHPSRCFVHHPIIAIRGVDFNSAMWPMAVSEQPSTTNNNNYVFSFVYYGTRPFMGAQT